MTIRPRLFLPVACLFISLFIVSSRADDEPAAQRLADLPPLVEIEADPAIPRLDEVVGHAFGEDLSSHQDVQAYLKALHEAAPDRTRRVPYGESYQGRTLSYFIISSPETIARLDEAKAAIARLADTAPLDEAQRERIIERNPAIVWLAYAVHGDETSSTDAALVTAYTLLADRREKTRSWLDDVIVILDPLQNPDGRGRFLASYRGARGVFPQADPLASERVQPWPRGRFNHYHFDLNRDWYLQSQTESQAKVAAYLDWQPQVYVDAHEMGSNSNYYFDPPSDPLNPQITERQLAWFDRIGRHQGAWFDRLGFAYTSREIFDSFYPGYGSTWPLMHGGLGILWEQASVRGLVVERDDDRLLRYRDAVRHHYVSGLSTIEVCAAHKNELLRDFRKAREEAVERGRTGAVEDWFLLPGRRPRRAARLARLLRANGIEVHQLDAPTTVRVGDQERLAPAGAYWVPVAQPAGRLAETLLSPDEPMEPAFIERQLERRAKRLPDEIYDITAWSLPLTFGVESLQGQPSDEPEVRPVDLEPDEKPPGAIEGPERPEVGYLVEAQDDPTLTALAEWLRAGLRVHVVDRPFTIEGRRFGRGTLFLKSAENDETFHETVRATAERLGLDVLGIDSSFVDEGAGLGGPNVHWVEPPRVLLVAGQGTSPYVGHTWHLFDQTWRYPTTRVEPRSLGRFDLDDVNVILLPDGSYRDEDGFDADQAERLRRWVANGGTLIVVRGALEWAMGSEIDLIPTERRRVPVDLIPGEGLEPPDEDDESEDQQNTVFETEQTKLPDTIPGAFLKANVYDDHWLTFGLPSEIDLLTNTNLIVDPLDPTEGRNLVTFAERVEPVSGFAWPKTMEAIARSPYLLYRSIGQGHVVGFTDDPNFRVYSPVSQRLFFNAAFFGPGH